MQDGSSSEYPGLMIKHAWKRACFFINIPYRKETHPNGLWHDWKDPESKALRRTA